MRDAIAEGLTRVDKLAPGHGFAELTAGVRGEGLDVVGFARGELGAKLAPNASVFAFAEAQMRGSFGLQLQPTWMAGIGARVTW